MGMFINIKVGFYFKKTKQSHNKYTRKDLMLLLSCCCCTEISKSTKVCFLGGCQQAEKKEGGGHDGVWGASAAHVHTDEVRNTSFCPLACCCFKGASTNPQNDFHEISFLPNKESLLNLFND